MAGFAQSHIVKDGAPMAEIVTDDNPIGSVRLAAQELQAYLEKISGAKLPIVAAGELASRPVAATGQNVSAVRIYVGRSPFTDQVGVSAEDLTGGAYRIRSGPGWLTLIGHDTVFKPQGIYATSRNNWTSQVLPAWDEATGSCWLNPIGAGMYMKYKRAFDMWRFDEKGTLNAVYGFLYGLGVRWYMPGPLGEIVPELANIVLPECDLTVRPQYDIRMVNFARFGMGDQVMDDVSWSLRLGFNEPYGYHTHHGISRVTRREEIREQHPEFYALYNNEWHVSGGSPNACLSSEGLFQENLRYVRFLFDMYDVPVVDVMPDDGFSSICRCEDCLGKDTPERGPRGVLSDYVWDYVNRIAIEVEKSHPGKFIKCGAYSTYWLPPQKIEKLNSNVLAYIVNGRRRFNMSEEDLDLLRRVQREWMEKTGNKVIIFMNHGGGANTPRLIADDMRNLQGISQGEDLWVPTQKSQLEYPGFNHLNIYIAALYHWNADLDIDEVLREYYRLFYGPAAGAMAEFIDFYELRQREFGPIDSAPLIGEALALFDKAKSKVDPASVFGQRVALFDEGLEKHRKRYELIKAGRVDVPVYHLDPDAPAMALLTIDGRLDEPFWQELPGVLRDVESGGEVRYSTRFKIGVHDNNLYVGVLCIDEPGQPFNGEALPKDAGGIWFGDLVEMMFDTPDNAYYQIAVNPAGSVADFDRSAAEKRKWVDWDAQAEIAVHADEAAGFWSVEARIPFTSSDQDPLHVIIGPSPSPEQPWHFNICRQRTRNQRTDVELSAYAPTGDNRFHNILKFGRLE
ncbi:MAG: DUF4838 domain-containing protein [Lentisphaerae bacterium]|nr:DUF4838 domain-containing protein [Lentisphaerota bacterium]